MSTAGGNELPEACPPTTVAVDDLLSATQSENIFGLGKNASSALNKTQKSLQLDINKINTTHGVMYLKTEEELREEEELQLALALSMSEAQEKEKQVGKLSVLVILALMNQISKVVFWMLRQWGERWWLED